MRKISRDGNFLTVEAAIKVSAYDGVQELRDVISELTVILNDVSRFRTFSVQGLQREELEKMHGQSTDV